jgi:hypothetical protein
MLWKRVEFPQRGSEEDTLLPVSVIIVGACVSGIKDVEDWRMGKPIAGIKNILLPFHPTHLAPASSSFVNLAGAINNHW